MSASPSKIRLDFLLFAITRLQEEQGRFRTALIGYTNDRLDGFIDPDLLSEKTREWRQTQKRLADQITEYQEAAHGIRLLELSNSLYVQKQHSSEKRKLLNFVCSNSIWKDRTHRDVSPTI
jgi:hypothetical protein